MKETFYHIPYVPKIAVLGDFHNGDYSAVLTSLRRNTVDIICIPGDLVYALSLGNGLLVQEQKNVLPLLKGCAELAPTFMSLGNHECILANEDLELIQATGTVILDNEWIQHDNIFIGGLTSHHVLNRKAYTHAYPVKERYDIRIQHKDWQPIEKPDLSWLTPLPSGYSILLSHHPEYYPMLPKVSLILSAHAHGGQWRIGNHGLFAPGQGLLPRWTSGLYGNMLVTKGLTNTSRIPRINNPTEIVYVIP